MKPLLAALLFAGVMCAAAPSIVELQPRGTQKGKPFTLTIAGQNLGEGPAVISNLPATFTALAVK